MKTAWMLLALLAGLLLAGLTGCRCCGFPACDTCCTTAPPHMAATMTPPEVTIR